MCSKRDTVSIAPHPTTTNKIESSPLKKEKKDSTTLLSKSILAFCNSQRSENILGTKSSFFLDPHSNRPVPFQPYLKQRRRWQTLLPLTQGPHALPGRGGPQLTDPPEKVYFSHSSGETQSLKGSGGWPQLSSPSQEAKPGWVSGPPGPIPACWPCRPDAS